MNGAEPVVVPQEIRVEHDPHADAAWVFLRNGAFCETQELDRWRLIDVDAAGAPLRIELLDVSRGVDLTDLPHADQVGDALRRAGIRLRQPAV